MEQRVSLFTLGVADVRRARAFYQHMGWIGQETEETVFIQAGGLAVVLWGRDKLALDCGVNDHKAADFSGIVLAHPWDFAPRRIVRGRGSKLMHLHLVPYLVINGGPAGPPP
jgi:hypothetical protein